MSNRAICDYYISLHNVKSCITSMWYAIVLGCSYSYKAWRLLGYKFIDSIYPANTRTF